MLPTTERRGDEPRPRTGPAAGVPRPPLGRRMGPGVPRPGPTSTAPRPTRTTGSRTTGNSTDTSARRGSCSPCHTFDDRNKLAIYKTPASSCNECVLKAFCTPHDEGQLTSTLASRVPRDRRRLVPPLAFADRPRGGAGVRRRGLARLVEQARRVAPGRGGGGRDSSSSGSTSVTRPSGERVGGGKTGSTNGGLPALAAGCGKGCSPRSSVEFGPGP